MRKAGNKVMEKFQIYLAGGMTDLTPEEQYNWRNELKWELEDYKCGYKIKCINPVEYYNTFNNTNYDSDLEVMKFDLYKVKHSDLIIVNFNNMGSLGTMAELAIAYDHDIPVIGLNTSEQQLHPWQFCMCSKIFNNVDAMLDYIKNYYLD